MSKPSQLVVTVHLPPPLQQTLDDLTFHLKLSRAAVLRLALERLAAPLVTPPEQVATP